MTDANSISGFIESESSLNNDIIVIDFNNKNFTNSSKFILTILPQVQKLHASI